MIDPKLLAHYRATPRPPVFLVGRSATAKRRPDWATIACAALACLAVATCAAVVLYSA